MRDLGLSVPDCKEITLANRRMKNRNSRKVNSENILPEKKKIANDPPTINKSVYQTRRFRHIIPAGGTTSTYDVVVANFTSDFGLPASTPSLFLESINAWAFADPTVPNVSLTLSDSATSKSFSDTSQIGQPASKVAYRYPYGSRLVPRDPVSESTVTTVTFTAGAQVVIDVILSILAA